MENIGDQAHVSLDATRNPGKQDVSLSGLDGISDEDKKDITQQIDKVVEENKIPITDDLFTLTPEKKGYLMPLIINLFAILFIGGGIYASILYFGQRQENLSLETQAYLSTEGKLIEELQKESKERLQAKDQEITNIQQELSELEKQRQELQNNMESTIRNREEELKKALEAELAAERARLNEQGISQTDIEARLEELETQRRLEYETELNDFRSEARAALQAKEEELIQTKQMVEEILERANKEREEIIATTEAQEAELRAQFAEERAQLESRSSEAEARLQELAAQREQEQLVNDQIVGAYNAVIQRIETGDTAGALEEIRDLKAILQDKEVQRLPAISKRKDIELFLIDTLEETLQETPSESTAAPASIVEAANMLIAAREIIARGDEAREAGNTEDAARLYRSAIGSIPSVSGAYASLIGLEDQTRKGKMEAIIRQAEELASSGDVARAVETYKLATVEGAGGQEPLAKEAVERITGLLGQREEQAVAEREVRIEELQEEIARGRNRIEELNTQLETVQGRLTAAGEENTNLNEILNTRETSISTLQGNVASLETMVNSLENELVELQEENSSAIAAYEERIAALQETQNSELTEREGSIASLRAELSTLEEENKELLSSIETLRTRLSSEEEARIAAESAKSQAEEKALLIAEEMKNTIVKEEYTEPEPEPEPEAAGAREDVDTSAFLAEGREEALKDVVAYLTYLNKVGREGLSVMPAATSERVKEDPLFAATVNGIKRLAFAGEGETTVVRTQLKLVGTVSSVTTEKVIVEPLVRINVSEGDTLWIKRRISGIGGEAEVGKGTVDDVKSGRIVASLTSSETGSSAPLVMDLVYSEIILE